MKKIVSAHYADDITIIIRQNRCFKEVIKEIEDYVEASGVFKLGVFFGNANRAKATFGHTRSIQ